MAFDDPRLVAVANAGRTPPVALVHRLGLGQLVDSLLDLGDTPGRAQAGDKILTLVASALAGGDLYVVFDLQMCQFVGWVRGARRERLGEPGVCWRVPGTPGQDPGTSL